MIPKLYIVAGDHVHTEYKHQSLILFFVSFVGYTSSNLCLIELFYLPIYISTKSSGE